jgi:hypothetical protein
MLELDSTLRRVVRTRAPRSSIALSVGVAVGLAATGVGLVHAGFTAPEPSCPPVVAPAPAARAAVAMRVTAPPCVPSDDANVTIADWTWGQDHLGPFTSCATIDRTFVERVLPGLDIRQTDDGDFVATRRGQPVLTVHPAPLAVDIQTAELETPWRIHVGDTFKTLHAHHHGMVCVDGDDGWCAQLGDGWRDNIRYVFGHVDDPNFDLMGPLKIRSIRWQPTR